eukprot:CAMPEP_0194169618 /NCGR_PEP_ID=MMETSP0154-20130528/4291_1 /TAXON_ID=1049557 /ORGANISM="Thalassiothrix antarctica, Strain L6-D1" /LENGTH=62 /DNA_ID=CAMNT_0038881095 /DNA_START=200 /DNA_END=389 /DNA_ORIENTATION=-
MIAGDVALKFRMVKLWVSIITEGECYELVVGSGDTSLYQMMTQGLDNLVIFAQYVPIDISVD